MLYTNFQGHWPLGSKEGDFWSFYHILAWKQSWSCDPEHLNKFSFQYPMKAPYEICVQNGPVFFCEKEFETVESKWPWIKVNEWPWPWVVINHHILIYLTICTNFHLTGFNSFLEIYSWSLYPYKNKRDQLWPCCKIGQGTHLNKLSSTQVTNAAYQVSRSSVFWFQRRRFF